ncbi:MAG: UbiA family prenyltransferase [Candidatus Lokiarchaeia archaeon]
MPVLKRLYHVARPMLSLIPVISFIIGVIMSLLNPISWSLFRHSPLFMFFILSILYLPVLMMSYLSIFLLGVSGACLNSLIDSRDSDLKGFRKDYQNPIIYHGVSPLHMKIIMISSAVISFIISLYVSLSFAAIILVGNLISITYSYYPRIKMHAPFDVVWNAVGLFTLSFIAGWVVYQGSPEIFLYNFLIHRFSLYYFIGGDLSVLIKYLIYMGGYWFPHFELYGGTLIGAAFYVLTAVLDYDGDKETGIKTISVLLGKRYSLLLSLVLYISGVLLMFEHLVFDLGTILFASVIAIFMAYLVVKPEKTSVWNLVKLALTSTLILVVIEILLRVSIS